MTGRKQVVPKSGRTEIRDLLQANVGAYRLLDIWRDWVECCALALSNSCDLAQRESRESRYLEIAKRYTPEQMGRFADALGYLVDVFETERYADVLGQTYGLLELTNAERGQYFTPYSLCRLMAQVTLDGAEGLIERNGYITVNEPTCGAGAMVIAAAEVLHGRGINYQQAMHATAQDIDATAVHMAYVQCSLLHIPAVVIWGDTLAVESRAVWHTPAHILGGWGWRLRHRADDMAVAPAPGGGAAYN